MNYSQLPSVNTVIQLPQLQTFHHELAVEIARIVISILREAIRKEQDPLPSLEDLIALEIKKRQEPKLRNVINATGIIIHTNLGRAPLPDSVAQNVYTVLKGYSNLELDLNTGKRGGRLDGVCDRICRITGAEAALVVNNNAAATLLAVSASSSGKSVLVSRGELVEIGGSFRIPDVIAQGGAKMTEVGTTNRTRLSDYRNGLTEHTGALLRVHPSNFRIVGFTERPKRVELVHLANEHGIPLIDDLGSGVLKEVPDVPHAEELHRDESIANALKEGVHMVTFSGDKLLGGVQAGFIVGSSKWIKACKAHPLYRALRVDKMTLAALEGCLILYETHRQNELPVWQMLQRKSDYLQNKAERLSAQISHSSVEEDVTYSGGGALPDQSLLDWVVVIPHTKPDLIAEKLRSQSPPVVLRISQSALRIHMRTLLDGELDLLVKRLRNVL